MLRSRSGASFLEFIVETLWKHSKRMLAVVDDFPTLMQSPLGFLSFMPVQSERSKLEQGLKQVKNLAKRAETSKDEQLSRTVAPLLEQCSTVVGRALDRADRAQATYNRLCSFLGDNPKEVDPEQLFKHLQDFLQLLAKQVNKVARTEERKKREERRRLAKESRKLAKEQKRNKKARNGMSSDGIASNPEGNTQDAMASVKPPRRPRPARMSTLKSTEAVEDTIEEGDENDEEERNAKESIPSGTDATSDDNNDDDDDGSRPAPRGRRQSLLHRSFHDSLLSDDHAIGSDDDESPKHATSPGSSPIELLSKDKQVQHARHLRQMIAGDIRRRHSLMGKQQLLDVAQRMHKNGGISESREQPDTASSIDD